MSYFATRVEPDSIEWEWLFDSYFPEEDLEDSGVWVEDNIGEDNIKELLKKLENVNWDLDYGCDVSDDEEENAKIVWEIIREEFSKDNGMPFTNKEMNALFRIIVNYDTYSSHKYEDTVVPLLTLLKGETYHYKVLRGYSSSEWRQCIYPQSFANRIDLLESILFGSGELYNAYFTNAETWADVDLDDKVEVWVPDYMTSKTADLIADQLDCKVEDLVILDADY